jgi:hypothetical protein
MLPLRWSTAYTSSDPSNRSLVVRPTIEDVYLLTGTSLEGA